MILNLLIPVYNNYQGLLDTILSLNMYKSNHKLILTIINDCSTDNCNYNNLIPLFQELYQINVYNTPYNMGPGGARQYGLDLITNNYVSFMDAGDIIYSPIEFNEYLNFIESNPHTFVFSPAHLEQTEHNIFITVNEYNNRMHGKVYQTAFLKKYNIHFNAEYTNMNEDIGFNAQCRFYCKYLQEIDPSKIYYLEYHKPIVVWTFEPGSLTRIDNYAFYFKQNIGLSNNIVYALNHALNNGIPFDIISYDIYEIFIYLYVIYISALNQRPEYLDTAFDGALYFYENALIPHPIDQTLLTQAYNNTINSHMRDGDAFCMKLPAISILDFILMLDKAYLKKKG